MSDRNEQLDSLDAARAAMRLRLGQEFRTLHRRRRQRRVAAISLVPLALVAAILAWNWNSRPPGQSPLPSVEQLATGPQTVPLSNSAAVSADKAEVAQSNRDALPSNSTVYQAIDYIPLKPDDLPAWLAEAKSDLIVYKVDGRTEVVSEQELLDASSKRRKQRVN